MLVYVVHDVLMTHLSLINPNDNQSGTGLGVNFQLQGHIPDTLGFNCRFQQTVSHVSRM